MALAVGAAGLNGPPMIAAVPGPVAKAFSNFEKRKKNLQKALALIPSR
ncbi:MAG: hypothetical protein MI753_01165 [Hyphomicrobiales bacterium]|nr:hypothetical protein [Hyphomicrobiales bacterium]